MNRTRKGSQRPASAVAAARDETALGEGALKLGLGAVVSGGLMLVWPPAVLMAPVLAAAAFVVGAMAVIRALRHAEFDWMALMGVVMGAGILLGCTVIVIELVKLVTFTLSLGPM